MVKEVETLCTYDRQPDGSFTGVQRTATFLVPDAAYTSGASLAEQQVRGSRQEVGDAALFPATSASLLLPHCYYLLSPHRYIKDPLLLPHGYLIPYCHLTATSLPPHCTATSPPPHCRAATARRSPAAATGTTGCTRWRRRRSCRRTTRASRRRCSHSSVASCRRLSPRSATLVRFKSTCFLALSCSPHCLRRR